MHRQRLAVVLLVAGAAALGGACGEDETVSGPGSVARSELGGAVGRVCSDYRAAAGSLPRRASAPAEFEARLARLQERTIDKLHALRPRTAQDEDYHEFVGAQKYAFYAQSVLRESGRSGEGDSPPARTARQAVDRAQRLAFRMGFDSCTTE
jgi:hypothetical protein